VIDYVNTLDVEAAADALATPDGLSAWLVEHGLLGRGRQPTSEDQGAEAIRLREALRALMLANNGGPVDADAWAALERTARRGQLAVHFDDGGALGIRPSGEDVCGALARVLIPVAASLADGSWQRAKACRAGDCTWAFYDRSRNRSAVWCEMAVCGNRTKVRAYRDRTAAAAAPPSSLSSS